MPKALQTLHQVSLYCVESVEVVSAEVAVDAALALEVISDDQDAVSNGNDGALPASPSGKLFKLSGEIGILRALQRIWLVGPACFLETRGTNCTRMLLRQASSCPGEITQIANQHRGYEAAPQESVLQKLRDPLTVLRVRLASGDCLDMLCLGQQDLKVTFENVPHRFPINARGCHVLNAELLQPSHQFAEFACRASEATNLLLWSAGLRYQNTGGDGRLVYVQSAAPTVQNFHGCLLPPCNVRMHKSRKSPSRAPLRRKGDSPLFSTASRVKLIRGLLGSTKANDLIRPRLRSA